MIVTQAQTRILKMLTASVLIIFLTHFAAAGDPALETTKVSTKKTFEPAKEVKAFYQHLVDSDAKVKEQFEKLTEHSRDENGGIFHAYDPQVVRWFPTEGHWNVSTGFDSDEYYLVLQPVGFGRGRAAGNDNVIASLFHVLHTGTTKYDEAAERAGAEPTLVSNKITITFLGFQHFDLKPIKLPK